MLTQSLPFLVSPFREDTYNFLHSIGQMFGKNPDVYARFGLKGHNGLDVPKNGGTPIYATHDGRIVKLQVSDTQGNGIWLLSNPQQWLGKEISFRTSYWHLQGFALGLAVGSEILTGQLIGYVDSTGFSTGNHLHFGLKPLEGTRELFPGNGFEGYIDPFKFFVGYSYDPSLVIGGTYDLDMALKYIIEGKEQYVVGLDGKKRHIYNLQTLNELKAMGVIVGDPVPSDGSVPDSGKEIVLITQE